MSHSKKGKKEEVHSPPALSESAERLSLSSGESGELLRFSSSLAERGLP